MYVCVCVCVYVCVLCVMCYTVIGVCVWRVLWVCGWYVCYVCYVCVVGCDTGTQEDIMGKTCNVAALAGPERYLYRVRPHPASS
jgi:hypothetical protein